MTTKRAIRVEEDFYETPAWMTNILLDDLEGQAVDLRGCAIFEPCNGNGRIGAALAERYGPESYAYFANDIDPKRPANTHKDATLPETWFAGIDWVITNPPFNEASKIIPLAIQHARQGVAALLRITFLEPVENRGVFLAESPPNRELVLPRWSFKRNGKTDSATCAWFIWSREIEPGIKVAAFRGPQGGLDIDARD